ncbi:MAG: hypothetical protein U5M23_00310 [Marinagarivorans sp.]|nr:hypothetical protein [Marinagarivorans sp.]
MNNKIEITITMSQDEFSALKTLLNSATFRKSRRELDLPEQEYALFAKHITSVQRLIEHAFGVFLSYWED